MASARSGEKKQVVLDTSFLLTLVKQHRDPIEEIRDTISGAVRILTLDLVVYELERLARKKQSTTRAWASASLELLKKREVPIVEYRPGPTDVDTCLISFAITERSPTAIATVDRELRNVLASQGIPAIWPKTRHGIFADRFPPRPT